MDILIKRDAGIPGKVPANKIHGKFPYKLYLEMLGNSLYGDYIAIISNKPIKGDNTTVNRVVIQLKDRLSTENRNSIRTDAQGARPNTIDGSAAKYNVREVNVLDIGNKPILVFRPVEQKEIESNGLDRKFR